MISPATLNVNDWMNACMHSRFKDLLRTHTKLPANTTTMKHSSIYFDYRRGISAKKISLYALFSRREPNSYEISSSQQQQQSRHDANFTHKSMPLLIQDCIIAICTLNKKVPKFPRQANNSTLIRSAPTPLQSHTVPLLTALRLPTRTTLQFVW